MSKILALDTSTEACSVALNLDGVIVEDFRLIPRRHTQELLPMVDSILANAGLALTALDAIAFGRGPGSFTGLRITTGVAQGLALGADLPLLPVSTLAALAEAAHQQSGADRVLAALDARMNEVYWGDYGWDGERMRLQGDERVCPPEWPVVPEGLDTTAAVGWGPGWSYPALAQRFDGRLSQIETAPLPRAYFMAHIGALDLAAGQGCSPEQAQPLYLRDQVARKKAQQ